MKFGDYQCYAVEMGDFLLDGGAMFGIVPKVLWNSKIPADENNRIPLKGRALLISGNNKNILVDTGCGSKFDPRLQSIYGITSEPPEPDTLLRPFGLTRYDITDVILTHLHFDHAGGATFLQNNEAVPSYPNARYYVSKKQWDWAQSPSQRDRASYFPENYLPLMERKQLTLIGSDLISPIDDIRFIQSDGHTPGQLIPVIESDETTLCYCGDLIPTSAHIPVPWHMGYDNTPLTLLEEKQQLLATASENKWFLFFEHDPVVACATVKQGKKGFEIDAILNI